MKKTFFVIAFLGIIFSAQAQTKVANNRLGIRSIMDFATTTKVYVSNRDSGVIVEKLGVDSVSNKGETAIIFRVRVITDTARFSTVQDQLLQQALGLQVAAKQLQVQATGTLTDAKAIESDVKTDIASRPKTTVQGILPNSYNIRPAGKEIIGQALYQEGDITLAVKNPNYILKVDDAVKTKPIKKKKRFFDFLRKKKTKD